MNFPLALLQASNDQMTVIMIGAVTLGVMIALGKRFFVALFEVFTAPGASLGYHGKENTFFFALMVVFLGGLIGLLYLTLQQPQISSDFTAFATDAGMQIAQSNSNPNYRDIAGAEAGERIDKDLQTYVVGNFILYPLYALVVWLVTGLLFFACSKMFGAQTSLSAFLGALAYPYFFGGIASALSLPVSVKSFVAQLFGQTPPMSMDAPLIIAGVLSLYAFILLCMAVVQAAEISIGQFIVCLLLIGILGAGVTWYFITYDFTVKAQAFMSEVTSFDPSKGGYKPSGGGGGYTPPAGGSSDLSEPQPPPPPSSGGGGAAPGTMLPGG